VVEPRHDPPAGIGQLAGVSGTCSGRIETGAGTGPQTAADELVSGPRLRCERQLRRVRRSWCRVFSAFQRFHRLLRWRTTSLQ
jgi:hypothetical protein